MKPPLHTALRAAAAFAVLQGAAVGVAWACSCSQVIDESEFDVGFEGEHLGTRAMSGCNPSRSRFVTHASDFEVTTAIKGVEVGDVITVVHGTSDASCGIDFREKDTWTVFAIETADGDLVTGLCSVVR